MKSGGFLPDWMLGHFKVCSPHPGFPVVGGVLVGTIGTPASGSAAMDSSQLLLANWYCRMG